MESPNPDDGTRERRTRVAHLFEAAARGDGRAPGELLPLVYDELRELARRQMQRERPGQTLQATALVHEAFVRLVGPGEEPARFSDRAHFFAAAARAMRRILVERARRKGRLRHGEAFERIEFPGEAEHPGEDPEDGIDLVALDGALSRLERMDARKAEVVQLRYFTGLTIEETAHALAISPATVKTDWNVARAWLHRELVGG